MTLYFSPATDGFYNSKSGVPVPADAIEITEDQYYNFLHSMNTENKKLILENGKLTLVDREPVINWSIIRTQRNRLLKDSDHLVMPDYPSDKQAWGTYRQQLRDIPQKYGNPNQVVWPSKPK